MRPRAEASPSQLDPGLDAPPMRLQFGPSHPATHGTVRIVLDLDGEQIVDADVQIGYLHRGFEKECETGYYYQNIPYTDRLNYSSAILCNTAYCMTVEKLLGITTPERCDFIRVIGGELSRMADHMLCVGSSAMELAAFTPFLYLLEARELVLDQIDALCGARITTNAIRIGGVISDLPAGFREFATAKLDRAAKLIDDAHKILTDNIVFRRRMEGTGYISPQDLIAHGVTGPMLRAGGVALDLRRTQPYLVYPQLDFDIPIGEHSDNFDRYLVRLEEIRQSRRMVLQCLEKIPAGPVNVDDPRIRWPGKNHVFGRMEELIDQFKLVTEGGLFPPGEVYFALEATNGEFGFYLVSDGTGKPYKCRLRSPSFSNLSPLGRALIGRQLADVVPSFGMTNMIGGECDR
ncbi:MAG: NADH-quinone oxidoreductase subunit D [Candidatus Binataceae bacterium]|nr:NADH-quinone oxidoreductase subunit D [Candidatus Binataceae bacterium]